MSKSIEANLKTISAILFGKRILQIPKYQRQYVWDVKQVRKLAEDCDNATIKEINHFCGSVIIKKSSKENDNLFDVIDGQQRITTISLIISALLYRANELEKNPKNEIITELSSWIKNKNSDAIKLCRGKVSSLNKDKEYYEKLIDTPKAIFEPDSNSKDNKKVTIFNNANYLYCKYQWQFADNKTIKDFDWDNIVALRNIFKSDVESGKINLVEIEINNDQQPHLVFESINSTGKNLETSDLIRNYLLLQIKDGNDESWLDIEKDIKNAKSKIEDFLLHFVAFKNKAEPSEKLLYDNFKEFCKNKEINEVIAEIREVLDFYLHIVANDKKIAGTSDAVKKANGHLKNIRETDVSTIYPLLLFFLECYKLNKITDKQLAESLHVVESYIIRKLYVNKSTQGLNKIIYKIATDIENEIIKTTKELNQLEKDIWKQDLVEILKAIIISKTNDTTVFPKNEDFKKAIIEKDAPKIKEKILQAIEKHLNPELGEQEFTVEHIIPKKDKKIENIGNLTLLLQKDNSKASAKNFSEKQKIYNESSLKLNESLKTLADFDESKVKTRAEKLANIAITVWPMIETNYQLENQQQEEEESYNLKDLDSLDDFAVFTNCKVLEIKHAFQVELKKCNFFFKDVGRKFIEFIKFKYPDSEYEEIKTNVSNGQLIKNINTFIKSNLLNLDADDFSFVIKKTKD
jgi:uncharacterized protein with ParB-like and HNH nuclease domain